MWLKQRTFDECIKECSNHFWSPVMNASLVKTDEVIA